MNIYIDECYKDNERILYKANALAGRIDADVLTGSRDILSLEGPNLFWGPEGLELTGSGQSFLGSFERMLPRLKDNNLRGEMLVKAARIKDKEHPAVIDCTAGMGEDSFLLAAAGFNVTAYEYNPVVAALLEDTVERAKDITLLCEAVSRLDVRYGDSIQALGSLKQSVDVIFLDPMFPQRQKNALVKKKFQLIHKLESPCANEEEMLHAALEAHPHKIVIKRPLKGPYLAGVKPGFSLEGKAIRYDVIVLN